VHRAAEIASSAFFTEDSESCKAVAAEFAAEVDDLAKKMTEYSSDVKSFESLLGAARDAVPPWSFAECSWLLKPASEDRKVAARKFETIVAHVTGRVNTINMMWRGRWLSSPTM